MKTFPQLLNRSSSSAVAVYTVQDQGRNQKNYLGVLSPIPSSPFIPFLFPAFFPSSFSFARLEVANQIQLRKLGSAVSSFAATKHVPNSKPRERVWPCKCLPISVKRNRKTEAKWLLLNALLYVTM